MWIIAGPCAVESKRQIIDSCQFLSGLGIEYIRGGAFKPRTSVDSFQGLRLEGLRIFREAADTYDLKIVTEVTDTRLVEEISEYADVLQIGARNMQNFDLLTECGRQSKRVILKRGLAATLDEWYGAAGYVLKQGQAELYMCERGHRTYLNHVRFMLDIAGIQDALLNGFKVIVDPSHAAGSVQYVEALTRAAIALDIHGVLIETHPHPGEALSDKNQQLNHWEFKRLLHQHLLRKEDGK